MSFQPPAPQPLAITGPSGDLEAILEVSETHQGQTVGVLCHPHPLHGGTMTNKVVHTVARTFNECGAAAVRFNYRGVGKSAGVYDEGRGETDDALAVIDWAMDRWPQADLWLAGFSFGGGVAFRAALRRVQVKRLITIAPAVAREEGLTEVPACPWLLVQGDQDEVIATQRVLDWVQRLPRQPEVRIISGASHFFHGQLPELRAAVRAWIAENRAESAA